MSNPYWQPAENEAGRMERVRAGIRTHVADPSKLMFFVAKSWNDNVVVYEYCEAGDAIVAATWLSLEPDDIARHQALGNVSLRSALNPAEELLFGCRVSVVEGGRFLVYMNQEQLAERVFELVLDAHGNPAVIGQVDGVMCRVDSAYAQMKKGPVPDVEYLRLYGRALSDNSVRVETLVNLNT